MALRDQYIINPIAKTNLSFDKEKGITCIEFKVALFAVDNIFSFLQVHPGSPFSLDCSLAVWLYEVGKSKTPSSLHKFTI